MFEQGPFVRKRPKKEDIIYKGWVWSADENGKDTGGGKTPIIIANDIIWFSKTFSVPLYWVTSVEPMGSGFVLVWHNELNREEEFAVFCVRTFLGYDLRKRDEIINAVYRAKETAPPVIDSEKSRMDILRANGCEKCGDNRARQIEFLSTYSLLHLSSTSSRQYYLCTEHARKTFTGVFILNTLANLAGIFGYIGLVHRPNIDAMVVGDFFSPAEAKKYKILSFVPLVCLVALITAIIFLT